MIGFSWPYGARSVHRSGGVKNTTTHFKRHKGISLVGVPVDALRQVAKLRDDLLPVPLKWGIVCSQGFGQSLPEFGLLWRLLYRGPLELGSV